MSSKKTVSIHQKILRIDSNKIHLDIPSAFEGIYQCYAEILKAADLSFHVEPKINTIASASLSSTYSVLNNFVLLFMSTKKNYTLHLTIQSEGQIDWEAHQYKLTNDLFTLLSQVHVNAQQLHPRRLHNLCNQYLSAKAIYDLNVRIYEKPQTELSLKTLAKLLRVSRNQLNYQQAQRDKQYSQLLESLSKKCIAINHIEPTPNMFWEMNHES